MANERARDLRKKMTPQEVKLWVQLRALRALGHHFRRQSPIPPYVVDFECQRARLIVEVDGGQHGFSSGQRHDTARDRHLLDAGYRIMRFWNNQVDREMASAVETILDALSVKRHPTRRAPSGTPPSPEGEG
jgi:very-short-patch-repair endonuclease